jgi:hypothetical protein
MSEDAGERARKYLNVLAEALEAIKDIKSAEILRVVDYVKRYLADGKYYLETGRPTTALASVAYAEGLLDSLSILGLIDTEPTGSQK